MHLILKIYGQSSFRRFDLNAEFAFAISIQNKGSYSVVLWAALGSWTGKAVRLAHQYKAIYKIPVFPCSLLCFP
jgi:hypothetical protein